MKILSLILFLSISHCAVCFSSEANSLDRFREMDIDGDGILEVWDVANSTYSDSGESQTLSSRLIRSFPAGATQILLIDLIEKPGSVYDDIPDIVWMPSLQIANRPLMQDFDGDGFLECGIDFNNDGLPDGTLWRDIFKPFGTLSVLVRDSEGRPCAAFFVEVVLPRYDVSQLTDSSGSAEFNLVPTYGEEAKIRIKQAGNPWIAKDVPLNLWSANSLTVILPKAERLNSEPAEIQIYPNPVASGGDVNLLLWADSAGFVQADLYDFSFRHVKKIFDGTLNAGRNSLSFPACGENGNSLGQGLYYAVVRSGELKKIMKMVVK